MKQPKKSLFILLLLLLCVSLLAVGTYAAYITSGYAKQVVLARTQNSGDMVPFSSNYLVLTDKNATDYARKTITAQNSFTLNLDIYNFPLKDITSFSKTAIEYYLDISIVKIDGSKNDNELTELLELTNNNDENSTVGLHSIPGGGANTHSFTINCKEGMLETLRQYIIRITATPTSSELSQKLAVDLMLVSATQNSGWQGRLADSSDNVDAFNYDIFGTARETKVLKWDPNQVALSPWSLEDLPNASSDTDGQVTLNLGEPGAPTSYRIQFYRVETFTGSPVISLVDPPP